MTASSLDMCSGTEPALPPIVPGRLNERFILAPYTGPPLPPISRQEAAPCRQPARFIVSARTVLTHFFGHGLDDRRHVVERYQSNYDGQIRLWRPGKESKGGRREARKAMRLCAAQRSESRIRVSRNKERA